MKKYSFITIIALCLAILLIDALSYYGLTQLVFDLFPEAFQQLVTALFWIFTIGLVVAILLLKRRVDRIHPKRKQLLITNLYGLTVSSFIPKVIFVLAILFLVLFKSSYAQASWWVIIPYAALFAGFLPFFVILYAIFKARYHFKVYHLTVPFATLPEAFNGLKIVQISDLHLGSFNFKYDVLERAVSLINSLEADLIFFTGDIVNNYAWELDGWERVLSKLKSTSGNYAVLGNHDYGDYSDWGYPEDKKENFNAICSFFSAIGFHLLRNEHVQLNRTGDKISILGVENWGKPPFKQYGDLKKTMAKVDSHHFKILLSHDPSHWSEEVTTYTDIALTLSGHTHGMQAGVNLRNRSWSPIQYKYKQWAGLYEYEDQFLYVNRGLGWMGFPGRLGMRPEITLITLEKT